MASGKNKEAGRRFKIFQPVVFWLDKLERPALLLDSQLNLLGMNAAAKGLLQFSVDDLQGSPIKNLLPQENLKKLTKNLRRHFDRFDEWHEPLTWACQDGVEFVADTHIEPIRKLLSKFNLYLCRIYRAEIASPGSEPSTVEIIDTLPDVVYRRTIEGRITWINQTVKSVLGYAPQEALVNIDTLLSDHTINDDYFDILDSTDTNQVSNEFLFCEFNSKDGQQILLQVREQSLYDDKGELVAIQGIIHEPLDHNGNHSGPIGDVVRYDKVFEHLNQGYWIEDRLGNIVDINAVLLERLQYRHDEIGSLMRIDLLAPDQIEPFQEKLEQNPTTAVRFESKLLSAQSQVIDAELEIGRVQYENDELRIIRVVDDSNTREMLKTLQTQNRDLTLQSACRRQLISGADPLEINRRIMQETHEMLNLHHCALLVEQNNHWINLACSGAELREQDEAPLSNQRVQQVLASQLFITREPEEDFNGLISGELKKQGVQSWIGFVCEAAEGRPAILYAASQTADTFNDSMIRALQMTARELALAWKSKPVEPSAQSTGDRLPALFKNTAIAMLTFDEQGRVELWNPGCEILHGRTSQEAQGKTLNELFAGKSKRMNISAVVEAVFSGDEVELIVDWSGRTLTFYCFPVMDEHGQVSQGVAIQADATQLRQLERKRVEAETATTIQDLAGALGNDMNNLLSAITGYADMMRANLRDDHPHAHYLKLIHESCSHSSNQLVRQLMNFAQDAVFQQGPVELNAVIRANVNRIQRLLPQHSFLTTRLAPNLPPFEGNAGQVEQALLNLCVHAADTLKQGGMITVETFLHRRQPGSESELPDLKAGTYAVLRISDDGCGIAREQRDRMFHPAFAASDINRGLGLPVVKRIVEHHCGAIDIRSEAGHGERFDLYFPIEWAVEPSEKPAKSDPASANEVSRKILVIENNRAVRNLLCNMLQLLGCSCQCADNGMDGVRMFSSQETEIDLVLLDMMMPVMSGRETYECLRAIQPDVPVIFISGFDIERIKRRMELGPQVRFLQKPIAFDKLKSTLQSVFANDRRLTPSQN